jgi:hypothetical protein
MVMVMVMVTVRVRVMVMMAVMLVMMLMMVMIVMESGKKDHRGGDLSGRFLFSLVHLLYLHPHLESASSYDAHHVACMRAEDIRSAILR